MSDPTRFHLIYDATANELVDGRFDFSTDAMAAAQNVATDRLGHTIIVFEPKEAFRSAAITNKVWLPYPERREDRPKAEKEPPPSPPTSDGVDDNGPHL